MAPINPWSILAKGNREAAKKKAKAKKSGKKSGGTKSNAWRAYTGGK